MAPFSTRQVFFVLPSQPDRSLPLNSLTGSAASGGRVRKNTTAEVTARDMTASPESLGHCGRTSCIVRPQRENVRRTVVGLARDRRGRQVAVRPPRPEGRGYTQEK